MDAVWCSVTNGDVNRKLITTHHYPEHAIYEDLSLGSLIKCYVYICKGYVYICT